MGNLLPFFGLTLLMSVPLYLLGLLLPASRLPMQIPHVAVMVVCPMLAAFLLWRRTGGRERLHWQIGSPLLTLIASGGILLALFIAGWLSPADGGVASDAGLTTILFSVPLFVIAAVPEEIGWTAYASPRAVPTFGRIGAGAIIGLIWAVWHWWPWAVLQGRPAAWVAGMSAISVMVRIIMTLLWARGGRSLGTAVLIHAMLNTAFLITPGEGAGLATGLAALLLVPVLAAVAIMPARGY